MHTKRVVVKRYFHHHVCLRLNRPDVFLGGKISIEILGLVKKIPGSVVGTKCKGFCDDLLEASSFFSVKDELLSLVVETSSSLEE